MFLTASFSSDAALVRLALADRPEAFEALIFRYQKKAYAIARAIGVPVDSLDDVIQEAFLGAFCGLRDLRSPASFGPWFLSIVRNLARKHIGRSLPASVRLDEHLEPVAGASFESEDVQELAGHLRREVLNLSEGLREAVFLYYYEGRSARQAAQALGISTSAVKVRLLRARDLLRERLWRSLEDSLRESLPSPELWKRRGRKLALFLVATVAMGSRVEAASLAASGSSGVAAAGASVGSGAAWGLKGFALGLLIMTTKKIVLISLGVALLISGGVVLSTKLAPRKPPAEENQTVTSRGPGARPGSPGSSAKLAKGAEIQRGAPAPAPAPRTGVSGTVFREGSPAPAGIGVAAHICGGPDRVALTSTREDGTYIIVGLKPDRYRLCAWSGSWTTRESDAASDGIEVREGEVTRGIDLTLIPGGILRGQVIEKATKDPIPGASLRCYVQSTATGPDGRFALEGIRPGRIFLMVKARGFARVLDFFEVVLGDESFVTIELAPGGGIEGTVTDPSGKPAPDVEVHVDWGATTGVRTDPGGRYLADGIPLTSEKITVTASRDGLFTVQATVPGFPPGESRVVLDLQLEKGFVLRGQVVDGDDRPVPGAEIFFGTRSTRGTRAADGEGRFVLEGASEKIETLTAQKKGFAPGTIVLTDLPPEMRESLRIVLRPGHFISGIVADTKGNPVEGATVYESPHLGTNPGMRTDAEGRFRIEDLPGILRSLSAIKEGYAGAEIEDVEVDRDDVRIVLAEAGQILGIAVDKATGAPVHPIRVGWETAKEQEGKGSSFSVGRDEFDVPDGSFKFTERIKAGQICKVTVNADDYGEAVLDGVEAWPSSESRDPIRVELEKGGILLGRVVDGASGSPLGGVKVSHAVEVGGVKVSHMFEGEEGQGKKVRRYWPSREYSGQDAIHTAVTDGAGKFQLKGIPDAAGALFLEKEGYARKAAFPVRPGPGLQVFDLVRSASLEGSVRTEAGNPIAEARVSVSVDGLLFPDATTDGEGRYRIDDLPAGTCEVSMERRSVASYMRAGSKAAVLTAGEVTVVDLTEPGGSIVGKVIARGGNPIPGARVYVKSLTDFREPMCLLAVDNEGAFRIGGVSPGPYDVRVELPGKGADLPEKSRKKVEVGSGETICDFSLDP
jgi:RNA polymerase sigma factor (sigma-70 family)